MLILATTREAEAVLEAVVGPVVDFRVLASTPEAEPRPAPALAPVVPLPSPEEGGCRPTMFPAPGEPRSRPSAPQRGEGHRHERQ